MNISATQNSILLDNGEYFFDDDFSIPFDANLRHEPLLPLTRQLSRSGIVGPTNENNGYVVQENGTETEYGSEVGSGGLLHARSDTCLHQREVAKTCKQEQQRDWKQNFLEGNEENDAEEGCADLNMSDFPSEPLFSPQQSMLMSAQSMLTSDLSVSLMGQSMDQQTRQLLKASYIRDNYHLTFHSGGAQQQLSSSQHADYEQNSRCWSDSSGSNLSTWASMAAQKRANSFSNKNTSDAVALTSEESYELSVCSPTPSSQMTSWGMRKQKNSSELDASESDRRTNPTLSGTTLLEMYSNSKGFELRAVQSRDALNFSCVSAEDDREYLPVRHSRTPEGKLSGSTRIRKARSFSNRIRTQGPCRSDGSRTDLNLAYPGVGPLSLPRSSKLEAQAFLSTKTLPDLSFLSSLSNSGGNERKPTVLSSLENSVTSRRRISQVKAGKTSINGPTTISGDSGFDSTSENRNLVQTRPRRSSAPLCGHCKGTMIRDSFHETRLIHVMPNAEQFLQDLQGLHCHNESTAKKSSIPTDNFDGSLDISVHEVSQEISEVRMAPSRKTNATTSSPMKKSSSEIRLTSTLSIISGSIRPLKSCLVRRSSSSFGNGSGFGGASLDRTVSMPTAINDSTCTGDSEDIYENVDFQAESSRHHNSGDIDGESDGFRVKKSVSFSERIQLVAMEEASSISTTNALSKSLNMPQRAKCIPRHWGLYGQDPFLAEFPLSGANEMNSSTTEVDERLCALVNDVMIAVQRLHQAHAHLLHQIFLDAVPSPSPGAVKQISVGLNTSFSFPTELGGHPLLLQVSMELIAALNRLLVDGLEPPSKQFFSKKPRSRLWNLLEESCKPGCNHRAAMEALRETKTFNASSEKSKFRTFILICLNGKALAIWFGHLSTNDNLLKRFYCEDSFLRQVRVANGSSNGSSLRLLFNELLKSLESLISIPFQLPINPLTNSTGSGNSSSNMGASQSQNKPLNKAPQASPSHLRPVNSTLSKSPSQMSVNSTAPRTGPAHATSTNRRSPQPSVANLPPSLANKFRNRNLLGAASSVTNSTVISTISSTARVRPLSTDSNLPTNTARKYAPNVPSAPGNNVQIKRSQSVKSPAPNTLVNDFPTSDLSNNTLPSSQSSQVQPSRMSWEKRAAVTSTLTKLPVPGNPSTPATTNTTTRIPTMKSWGTNTTK